LVLIRFIDESVVAYFFGPPCMYSTHSQVLRPHICHK